MSKDYGEPLELRDASDVFGEDVGGKVVVDRHGGKSTWCEDYADFPQEHKDLIERELACTNALNGIPKKWMQDVKRATVVMKVFESGSIKLSHLASSWVHATPNISQYVIDLLNEKLSKGETFGREFDKLIRECK